ncbi:MAG: hypothetical protein OEW49_06560 [Nitrosopumilus sp.]|nr:hypothetical protein [Nitrosopumilus sp.]
MKPFLEKNPDFPKEILGYLMSSYYGGRAEVRIAKKPVHVTYLDFTSMYPTMAILLEMNRFLASKKIICEHAKQKTQEFLDHVTLEQTNKMEFWPDLVTLCKIAPNNDMLPVRSNFGKGIAQNTGLNYVQSTDNASLWYALPDLIASKLLTGKTPIIQDAITFLPQGIQDFADNSVAILKDVSVDPARDDFILQMVQKRLELKKENSDIQGILKIMTNAISYGVFIQVNSGKPSENTIYGLESFECKSKEYASKYFNPIIATFLTAGARLILAGAESLVLQNNGYMAYCDTDGIMVSPRHTKLVQDFFRSLNPYNAVEMFKIEKDENGTLLHDVLFYGISSKRYTLYKTAKHDFQIFKYSLHGLGHLFDVDKERWWKNILHSHYAKNYCTAEYDSKYSMSKMTVTTPHMLEKLAHTKIKPFSRILIGTANRMDSETGLHIIPMLPWNAKCEHAPFMPFVDYNSGKKYPCDLEPEFYWKPLAENFVGYVNHADSKSSGSVGILKRLKVRIDQSSIQYIGKESKNLAESEKTAMSSEPYTKYENIVKKILRIRPRDSWRIGISRSNLILLQKKARDGRIPNLHNSTLHKILEDSFPKLTKKQRKGVII